MKSSENGEGVSRIELAARMDRRSAEALALALRRRLKELGHDGVTITVTTARDGAGPAVTGVQPSST